MALPDSEGIQVIELFNATRATYPQDKLIHELLEEQVERTPEAVAVVCEGKSLTYAQLNARANQLARYLIKNEIGPDRLVGIYIERSLEMVVGLLGILKAGGAYVPLDPKYPYERLQYMLQDAAPKALLIQGCSTAGLPNTAAKVIRLNEDWSEIARQGTANLDAKLSGLRPDHMAYVIHTSGSTGDPKGVMIEHHSVVNFLIAMRQRLGIASADCLLAVTTVSFDIAALEIYLPLCIGAKIALARREDASDASRLMDMIESHEVSILQATPATWKLLLSAGWKGRKDLKALCGGEALTTHLSGELLSRVGTLWNLYGPTETTIWSCSRQIAAAPAPSIGERGAVESIGQPIANTQIYILNSDLQPVPIGASGEIHIGGAGVARGYLNRPDLTAERFVPDPFSPDPQARMYKTGDIGRWQADGDIEYLGRNDQQVKIRGFRVELGEIEAHLVRHARVKDAVVVTREDIPGDKRLVAYVVGKRRALLEASSDPAADEMRRSTEGEWMTLRTDTFGVRKHAFAQLTPELQSQRWLDCAVERLRALRPRRVLEVGCGMGLLLQRLAPMCERYVGTVYPVCAIGPIQSWIDQRDDLRHVQLLHRTATELQDMECGLFDTVVLNSVVQYFPDSEYLLSVLRQALRLLGPGGKIFIGDVRHHGLLPTFHSAVQLHKAPATINVGELKKRVARAVALERELVIDPRFFRAIIKYLPGISVVDVQLRRGQSPDELTGYLYDVVLHTGNDPGPCAVAERLDWKATIGSTVEFEARLQQRYWSAVRMTSIPNSRLSGETAAQRLIETSDERLEIGAIRRQLSNELVEGIDPELFWNWGETYDYDVHVSWGGEQPGDFEVELLDRTRADQVAWAPDEAADTTKQLTDYINDPLNASLRQQLIAQLRAYLKKRLPEYMIPSVWVTMGQMPLTQNGKIDRRGLPEPGSRPEEAGEYVPPCTEVERVLADIWAQILRVDQIGVKDSFFELGGHSLHAMKLIAKVAELLSVDLSVAEILQSPTIEQIAKLVESTQTAGRDPVNIDTLQYEEGVV